MIVSIPILLYALDMTEFVFKVGDSFPSIEEIKDKNKIRSNQNSVLYSISDGRSIDSAIKAKRPAKSFQ